MFVQPITPVRAGQVLTKTNKRTNFKGVEELEPYMNYIGPEPSETERVKYNLSVEAVYYEGKGDYARAAEAKMKNAQICLKQGLKDDAEKLMKTATEYLAKVRK